MRRAWVCGVFCAVFLLGPGSVPAHAKATAEAICIDALDAALQRMVGAQSDRARGCLREQSRSDASFEACLDGDAQGRIERARETNRTSVGALCEERPASGGTDLGSVNSVPAESQRALLESAFGPDLDEALEASAGDAALSVCQVAVTAAVDRCHLAKLQVYRSCKRALARSGAPTEEAAVAACADAVATARGGAVARACDASQGDIRKSIGKLCESKGVDLAAALPGCGSGGGEQTAVCLARSVECQTCLELDRAGFLDRDCDAFDDGERNRSCLGSDRWGGWTGVAEPASGRFRVDEVDGLWWFLTPDGHGFFSAGVNNVDPFGDFSPPLGTAPYYDNVRALYGSEEAWREVAYERLGSWKFNTMGAFSSLEIHTGRRPYTPVRGFHSAAPEIPGWPPGQTGKRLRDYFDPAWPIGAAARAEGLRFCAEDPFCVGVYSDNELPWGPGVFMVGTFVDAYMSLPAGAPGKRALQAFFEERYAGDLGAFNSAWGLTLASFDALQALDSLGSNLVCEAAERTADRRAFLVRVAERYFGVVHDALRALDPELLILGSRLTTTSIGPDVVRAAGPYVDVLALNHYLLDAGALNIFAGNGGALYDYYFLDNRFADLGEIHDLSGRPLMVTEYTMRTPTPDVPVLFPPFFPTFETQEERTDAYEEYQRQILSRPFMVGTHWFEWFDQPATGRSDGENSRFGVVDIEDTPYAVLTRRMRELNGLVSQRPIEPPDAVIFPDPAPVAATTAGEAHVVGIAGIPAPGGLAERVFSVAPTGSDRTGFYVGLIPGLNVGDAHSGGHLVLRAGELDVSGEASLQLAEDVVLGMRTIVGDIVCVRLEAATSDGVLSCGGGVGHDVVVTREGGMAPAPPMTEAFLGPDAGPGAATLIVSTEIAQLPAGSALDECIDTDAYEPAQPMAFSTASVTTTKGGAEPLVLEGENFVCGSDREIWSLEDGPGMFAFGLPVFDGRVPGGDLAAGLLLADRADACP